jgi:hypothetical protein
MSMGIGIIVAMATTMLVAILSQQPLCRSEQKLYRLTNYVRKGKEDDGSGELGRCAMANGDTTVDLF